ncbi:MAG: putative transport system permease protein [Frankiales bacterium]|nr:putative transport system permease protein [Frankiales bacterium]
MWVLTFADVRMRARQFAIATIGTALVFSMALVIAGLSGGFRAETRRSVEGVGGDGFLVTAGSGGPFTSVSLMPSTVVDQVRRLPGVTRADPILVFQQRFSSPRGFVYGPVIAGPPGGLGAPPVRGLAPLRHGEAVVDDLAKVKVGETFTIGNERFRAVRRVHGYSILGGLPNVYISLADAQALAFSGRDVETAVAIRGRPTSVPRTLALYTNQQARQDVLDRLGNAVKSIDIFVRLLWLVAAVIIGAVVYLSSLERLRDFAVLKAIGSSSRQLYAGLAAQAVLIALLAAAVAIGLLPLIATFIPIPLAVPVFELYLLPIVAIVVGLLASLSGLRQAVRVDPALAFASG